MRIALCDDHALVRDGLKPFLLQLAPNVEIIEAASFGQLIDAVRAADDVSLCILDLRMPDLDPIGGLTAVRKAFPDLRIAVLSSICDPRMIGEILEKGAQGFIPKRMHVDAILSALKLVIGGETFVPSLMFGLGSQPPAATKNEPAGSTDSGAELTIRERQVLALVREGLSNKGIARQFGVSEVTVKTHLSNVFKKLGVQNRLQAARVWRHEAG